MSVYDDVDYDDSREPFVTYTTLHGEDVRVEIDPADQNFMPVRPRRSIGSVAHIFRPALNVAGAAVREAREFAPDEVSVRFGVKVTAGGDAMVAKSVSDCHFEITLTWSSQGGQGGRVIADQDPA